MTSDDDELLDLVNKHDQVVGTVLRSDTMDTKFNGFLRAAEAFIVNSRGQLWIPRRQPHKRIAPGGLDYSMGEHVKAGEEYLAGCLRGFKEELNLSLTEVDLKFIKKFAPTDKLYYFRNLYIYYSDEVPRYNPKDFSEYFWLTPKELISHLKSGEPAKDSLIETATYLSEYPEAL